MNKLVKRVSLFFVGAALITWGYTASVQAYDIKPAELRVIVTGLGQKIPGSAVVVTDEHGETVESGETAGNGELRMQVAPGVYTISVEGTYGGSDSGTLMLFEDELRQKNFELGLEGALPHGSSH